jgi:hypothetical protein
MWLVQLARSCDHSTLSLAHVWYQRYALLGATDGLKVQASIRAAHHVRNWSSRQLTCLWRGWMGRAQFFLQLRCLHTPSCGGKSRCRLKIVRARGVRLVDVGSGAVFTICVRVYALVLRRAGYIADLPCVAGLVCVAGVPHVSRLAQVFRFQEIKLLVRRP